MANTYTQINLHIIFSVKGRGSFLTNEFSEELFKYISGILASQQQFPLAVNGYRDHVHLFFEYNPTFSVSDLVRIIKANSSKWINERQFISGKFSWQEGYGGFSYSRSQRDPVIKYIINQKEHHRHKTFKEEYLKLLEKFGIRFDESFVFDFYDQ